MGEARNSFQVLFTSTERTKKKGKSEKRSKRKNMLKEERPAIDSLVLGDSMARRGEGEERKKRNERKSNGFFSSSFFFFFFDSSQASLFMSFEWFMNQERP